MTLYLHVSTYNFIIDSNAQQSLSRLVAKTHIMSVLFALQTMFYNVHHLKNSDLIRLVSNTCSMAFLESNELTI